MISSIPSQADFSGLNGAKDLHLSSFLQINTFSNKRTQVAKRLVHLKKHKKKLAGEEEETELGGEEGEGGEGDELPQEEEQADQNLQTPLRETIHVSRESSQNSLLTGLPIQVCRATQPNGPGGAPGKVPPTPGTRAQLT